MNEWMDGRMMQKRRLGLCKFFLHNLLIILY
jgi:hypothetical protein